MADVTQNRPTQPRPRPMRPPPTLNKIPPIKKQYLAPAEVVAIADARKPTVDAPFPQVIETDTGRFFSATRSLLGLGEREYAFGPFPKGYGLTVVALTGCYGLLRWEKNKIDKNKRKPPCTSPNLWFSKLKNMEKEYALARNDLPRTVMLLLVGGLGMPYTSSIGAVFWCVGRATDFHEAEERRYAHEQAEAVLCRFGKFLMICGVCKFFFDFARGKVNGILG